MSASIPIDEAFLARLRNREPEALDQAVRENARTLFRAARGLGFDSRDAEDLVQDVFVTLLQNADRFEGRSQLRTWLFGVLRRKALERRRDTAAERISDSLEEVFESRFDKNGSWLHPPGDIEKALLSGQLADSIGNCLKRLPGSQREAFVLREMEDLETGEICKILEISATNLGVLIHRARIRLRECLEAKGWGR